MGVFGSTQSGGVPGIKVTLVAEPGGRTTLIVNEVPYGTATQGRTKQEDSLLVNSELSTEGQTEALVGLMSALSGEGPDRISKVIEEFRRSRNRTT